MRGRYPSEVRIILKPRKASLVLRRVREKERGVFGRNTGEKNRSSYIDSNLRYYRISLSCRKRSRGLRGSRRDPIHVTEDWVVLQLPILFGVKVKGVGSNS